MLLMLPFIQIDLHVTSHACDTPVLAQCTWWPVGLPHAEMFRFFIALLGVTVTPAAAVVVCSSRGHLTEREADAVP